MINNGPTRKALVALDLDHTHFNSSIQRGVHWLGKEQDWVDFYQSQVDYAKQQGVELYFMVITNKPTFDDIAEAAAKAFAPFLSLGNQHTYRDEQNERWCLVKIAEGMQYESLSRNAKKKCDVKGAFSHFVVLAFQDKAPHILELAQRHGIPAEQCLLLDDMAEQLNSAKDKGLQTVSFEEFCPDIDSSVEVLSDPKKIDEVITLKRQLIAHQIKKMVLGCYPERLEMNEKTPPPSFCPLSEYYTSVLLNGMVTSFRGLFSNEPSMPTRMRHLQ